MPGSNKKESKEEMVSEMASVLVSFRRKNMVAGEGKREDLAWKKEDVTFCSPGESEE